MSAAHPLEPDAAEMRRLVDEAMRRIVAHIESLPSQPAANVDDATDYARTLVEPLPTSGTPYETLLDHLFDDLIPRSFNAAGPGYLAYVPGGGIFHAAVADLIADSVNRYTAVVTARKELLGDDFLRGTLYCSDQVHHSFQKAANLAGFPYANIRELPV